MFRGHHRQIRLLFGASDAALLALAFALAYWTRSRLELTHNFYIVPPVIASLAAWVMLVWVGLGYWWEIYDHIDLGAPRVILRDAFRQCLVGSVLTIIFEYAWRLDLSRSFVGL